MAAMAIGRLTNRGREMREGLHFNGTALGLDNNGSAQPSYWVALLRNQPGLFMADNNGPKRQWNTIALLQAEWVNSVILPTGNYTDHDIPVGSFTITRDDNNHFVRVVFTPGLEPLLTVTNAAGIEGGTNLGIGGWALMTKQAPANSSDILGIFPAQAPITTTVPQNYRIRIRDFQLFTQST